MLTEDQWRNELLQASFEGIEHVTNESGESPISSMMVIKAADEIKDFPLVPIKLIQTSQSALTKRLSKKLHVGFKAQGLPVSAGAWDRRASEDVEKQICVILDNSNQPILSTPSADEFESLKSVLTQCHSVLWVSFRDYDSTYAGALQALVTGIARVVRRETDIKFITLDVKDFIGNEIEPLVASILKVTETSFLAKNKANSSQEYEYAFSDGKIEIPRIHLNYELNSWEDRTRGKGKVETCIYSDPNLPLKLEVETPGLLNSLRFVHDEKPSTPLEPTQIQVEALTYGVNFRDVFIALGQMPTHLSMAGEVCGIVTSVGSDPDTQAKYKVGDRIAGMSRSPFCSYPRLQSLHAWKVPNNISSAVAASIPGVYLTAYHSLIEIAHLQKGQTVLIHSASGGVGQASIQIARYLGAEIFATVGSARKRDFLIENYGIPEDHIFSSRSSASFKQGVMRLTEGKGVDVVLNSLSGELLSDSWDCLAECGTHVEIGKADIYKGNHLNMKTFDRNTTFAAVDLFRLSQGRPHYMYETLGKCFELISKGVVAPVQPLNILPMDQIETAFRLISDRKHIGKVILEAKKDIEVKAVLPPPVPLRLDSRGTYVIGGGLGDLGRKLAVLLAKHGAGHIVTLSRRTLDEQARAQLEENVRQLGGQLHIEKCDITDRSSVDEVAARCSATLPPVRGVIQCGMVLKASCIL